MGDDVLNNLNWSGYLQTWAEQVRYCSSEEDLYKKLNKFKTEFNSAYGKLSRKTRRKRGFSYTEDE